MTAERLTREQELRLLTDWHARIYTNRAVALAALWASDGVGAPILWRNVSKTESERLDWTRTAESCFEADVMRYALRNVGFVASLAQDMAK